MAGGIQAPFFLLLLLVLSTVQKGTSVIATTTPIGKNTQSSTPSQQSATPSTLASASSTVASSTVFPHVSSSQNSPQAVQVSFFFLSFYILNHQFNSSLEDPRSKYYQELKSNISELFSRIFNGNFLGFSGIKFRPGSVVVESTLVFREGTISADEVQSQVIKHSNDPSYGLIISKVSAREVLAPSSAQSRSGVPGWGIALLVLVCVLVTLAIIYLLLLALFRCRRKNYGQLDLFPARDTYHPMSEYPTYHTHGRYVAPGNSKRSPYEEVSAGNGGGLSYTNPAVSATSADL
ncbi:mucin-1 [Perognathus longimembris pacificus]|uniref:mucin-1 n=1 Tax=Perognathus longimembris pacificus TaxID=214514 RepID=UPI002019BC67|nr:mucin-1 [Perognathus longimembris pacificus]